MIAIKNLTKIYNSGNVKTVALDGVSFSVKKGEFVAIMGPSGSGKSTLMYILGALDTPTNGQYFLDGKDVSKLSDDDLSEIRKEKVGFVFQSFNLLPRATMLRNVILPLIYDERILHSKRESLAIKALEDAGLGKEHFEHLSNQLSGGQMQRVAIARALVNDPALILADEPTGNLDTKTGEVVLKTFQKLNKEQGRTIVLITHEPYVAKHAHRIIHVQDGKILADNHNAKRIIE